MKFVSPDSPCREQTASAEGVGGRCVFPDRVTHLLHDMDQSLVKGMSGCFQDTDWLRESKASTYMHVTLQSGLGK